MGARPRRQAGQALAASAVKPVQNFSEIYEELILLKKKSKRGFKFSLKYFLFIVIALRAELNRQFGHFGPNFGVTVRISPTFWIGKMPNTMGWHDSDGGPGPGRAAGLRVQVTRPGSPQWSE